jgi:hypothetical protein
VAVEDGKENSKYCPHENAFAQSARENQDLLWKYTLPAKLRKEVLGYLKLHNITAYSLFGSEETLMESLAVQQFVLRP